MSIREKIQSLLVRKDLHNSLGVVARNYGKVSDFQPNRQVRGITYKAIDKIGQSLSVYEPVITKPGQTGDAMVNHPLLALFNSPNPAMNATDFIYLWAMLFEIYGETFWYKAPGQLSGKVRELYLLSPGQMELKISGGELVGYVLHKSNGEQVPFMVDEIVHDKRPNPFNEWRGMSVLERASVYVDTEITVSNFTFNYLNNSASPSGIVSLPDMEQDAFQRFTLQWREGYEGPENAGKTAFIRGGEADFKAVGATLHDVDAKMIKDMSKDDVLMMFDVPKPLLGLTDQNGFGRGNVETLNYIFAKEKLEPMMRRLDRIYEDIGKELQNGKPIDVTHESPIPEDKEFEHTQNKDLVNVALTINEVRERMGLAPLNGGDELQPQNRAGTTLSLSSKNDKKSKKATKSIEKIRIVKKKTSDKDLEKKLNQDQEEFRVNLVTNNEIYERRFKQTLNRHLTTQANGVLANFDQAFKIYDEILFDVKKDSEKLANELAPVIIALMEEQGKDVANFITGELLTISPEMRTLVQNNLQQLSGVYNTDTIKAIERTLTEGQTAGESLPKLRKRVEQVYSDAKGYRAERIARTETLHASNMTAAEVYKQNGYTQLKWFINPGACEFCRSMANQTSDIGQPFINIGDVITGTEGNQMSIEYRKIQWPPLHPNCTCSVVPV